LKTDHAELNRWIQWSPPIQKVSGGWLLRCFDGGQFPFVFKTKKQAVEMGWKHHEAIGEQSRWKS